MENWWKRKEYDKRKRTDRTTIALEGREKGAELIPDIDTGNRTRTGNELNREWNIHMGKNEF